MMKTSSIRKLQLPPGGIALKAQLGISHGPIIFAYHPHRCHLVGLVLDGCGLGGWTNYIGSDHPFDSVKQSIGYEPFRVICRHQLDFNSAKRCFKYHFKRSRNPATASKMIF